MNIEVKCKNCGWYGEENELVKFFDEVEMSNLEKCPNCNDIWSLIEELKTTP